MSPIKLHLVGLGVKNSYVTANTAEAPTLIAIRTGLSKEKGWDPLLCNLNQIYIMMWDVQGPASLWDLFHFRNFAELTGFSQSMEEKKKLCDKACDEYGVAFRTEGEEFQN
ncbi:hypothetical protein M378DRAFT_198076 [Amanita muscaria Koide BX008]|uniref:Uncharacterized protein n=1 Tax=Amanita muscaria (strain Koide BX008) TaxID=946122 RepID=A0A0C2X7J1_AMAMK|nr:hypothetical protein M378DRAFT_198076 [Amanita muscaria Koide BX008]